MTWVARSKYPDDAMMVAITCRMIEAAERRSLEADEPELVWPEPETWRDGCMRLYRRSERWLTSSDAWRFVALVVAGFLVAVAGTIILATVWGR